ncbi:cystathionine gamma-synthase family protein [Sphingomonas nostoxanthinifaciens]|uniref:cystathionine gamma-synthase family protein n=1 Tax=Sphingomonas nostoxanthinifaciens TaxID=2872652 RepID=UPI001CC1FF3B|nr:cystathionine gamma-synthase family protein [Sphingomonas nostoxanthinifaciens]UAK24678.1 cystathionine gamma-synthase family protein [Sphingomonas nostoxanthinifaciens]
MANGETEADLTGGEPRRRPREQPSTIGGRKLSAATLMMGHGYDPRLSEGSLKPPLFLTSTYVFESAAAGKRHFEGVTGKRPGGAEGLVYSRFNGPNQEILEDRLALWEEAEEALTFGSGMAAIATVLLALVQPGDVIVHSAPLYAATETLIGKVLGRFGVKWVDFPAGATRDEIDAALAQARALGRVALVYLESPANPTNALVDVEAVAAACDAAFDEARPPIVIDNTFLGPLWQQPLKHGADMVVYSLTKYAGGHSDLVAGGLVGTKAAIDPVRAMRNTIGTILDPHPAWMLLRSLETLELRMSRAGENAAKVCAFLRDHPKVEHVGYLAFLEDGSRQADIYRRHCTGAGSTFSLYLKGGETEAFAFLDALVIAKLAVSLGGTETLASHPAAMTHLSVPDARKTALGIGDNLVRISIGVEDAGDLIADFDQALAKVG